MQGTDANGNEIVYQPKSLGKPGSAIPGPPTIYLKDGKKIRYP